MKRFIKRSALAMAGLVFLAACGDKEEDKVVNVYNWSDYIDEDIIPRLIEKAKRACKVHLEGFLLSA